MNAYIKKQVSSQKGSRLNIYNKPKNQDNEGRKAKKALQVSKKEYLNSQDKSKFNSKSSKSKKSDESQYHRNQYKKNPDRIQYYNQENLKTEKKNQRKVVKDSQFNLKTSSSHKNIPNFRMPPYQKKKHNKQKDKKLSQIKVRVSEFQERSPSKQKFSSIQKRKSERSSILLFGAGKSQYNLQKRSKSESTILKSQKLKFHTIKQKKKKNKNTTPKKQNSKIQQKSLTTQRIKTLQKEAKQNEKQKKHSQVTKQFTKSSLDPRQDELNIIQQVFKKEQPNLSQIRNHIVDQFCIVRDQQLRPEILRERFKSISMLGKICYSMLLKKSSFLLALAYLDRYIDNKTNLQSIKAAVIASLMISLKVEHAEVFGNIEYQFSESTTCESRQFHHLIRPQLTTQKPKIPNILNVVLSHEQIFSEYDRILGRDEINQLEMQIIAKLNFRLQIKSISYWIQMMVGRWQKFLSDISFDIKYSQTNIFQKLMEFKNSSSLGIMGYLYQICEISQIVVIYSPKPIIVLSAMYLLIRISVAYASSEWDKGFQYYRVQLSRSANAVFIDKIGCNQIFGDFLGIFGLDLGGIVNCCQLISRFFSFRTMKGVIEDSKKDHCKKDFSLYFYSPDLFRFLASRID